MTYQEQLLWVCATHTAIFYAGFMTPQYPESYHTAQAQKLNLWPQPATPWPTNTPTPKALTLVGTPFQQDLWQRLSHIALGQVITYKTLGQWLTPASQGYQAIGNAVGANPISGLLPCHRVLPLAATRKGPSFNVGGFRWGTTLKTTLLAHECIISAQGQELG
jgi:O-6-methylguanine DNA methyltransferase